MPANGSSLVPTRPSIIASSFPVDLSINSAPSTSLYGAIFWTRFLFTLLRIIYLAPRFRMVRAACMHHCYRLHFDWSHKANNNFYDDDDYALGWTVGGVHVIITGRYWEGLMHRWTCVGCRLNSNAMNIKGLEKHPFERMIYVIQRSKSERMALCTLRVEHCEMNASDEMGGHVPSHTCIWHQDNFMSCI